MKSKYEINLSDIKEIEAMAEKGASDVVISKDLGIKRHVVQGYTTKFWQRKMKNKK